MCGMCNYISNGWGKSIGRGYYVLNRLVGNKNGRLLFESNIIKECLFYGRIIIFISFK